MNSWIDFSFAFMIGAALLVSVAGLWLTAVMPSFDRWSKRFFQIYFVVLMLTCFSCLLEMVLIALPGPRTAMILLLVLESLLLSLPLPMQTFYLLYNAGESVRSSKLLHSVLGLWTVYFVLIIIAPFTNAFSYVAPDNQYYRGPWYPLLLLPMAVIALLNLAGTIQRRNQLSHRMFVSLLISLLPMTVALLVQMFVDIYPIVDLCFVLSAFSMYSLIISDQIERDLSHQREIAHERASVMVLQMRPHFIYNTLMTIHSLCRIDPQKARQVTMDFADYLRKNFNAVASDSTIPFSIELEHTRAYLAVEQAQLDDMLVVDWDTPFTHFRLPPLTLQPIVENAVKHGMNPDGEPLNISIQTRHTDAGTEIIVEDTGPGFDPSDESKPHTALKNIQQRLEMMCGGTLEITSREAGGARVTIRVPLKNTK